MTYDENVFKEKANRKARKIWIVFAILLSANYGSDAFGGLYPTTSYLIFLALCLAASDLWRSAVTCKGLGNGALPLRSGHRLRHLLYLCHMHHGVTDRIHLHPSGDKFTGPV